MDTSTKLIVYVSILFAVILALVVGACDVSDGETTRVLSAQGFTDVKTHGHAWFACSKDDSFATSFTAKNPAGVPVSGAVCCGLMKSCTVRF